METVLGEHVQSTDEMFDQSVSLALQKGFVKSGDKVVITAGVPIGKVGTTNLIKVHVVSDIIANGIGIGSKNLSGIARIVREPSDEFNQGEIFVGRFTDIEYMDKICKASAIIVEEGGLTGHAAIVGVSLGIPVIVGADGILDKLNSGEQISIDVQRGIVYRGKIEIV